MSKPRAMHRPFKFHLHAADIDDEHGNPHDAWLAPRQPLAAAP
jgi:hypothetical protein